MLTRWRQGNHDRNIALYFFITLASDCFFLNGNWLFFWLRVMSYETMGIVDGLSFAFGLLMEIPTGAVADMLGKKRTVIVGLLCHAFGWCIMAATNTLLQLIVGFWLAQIGWAFLSGSLEALAYDSLKENGREARYDRVASTATIVAWTTVALATLIGGLWYRLDERLPHYATGFAFGLGALAAFWLREPKVESTAHFSLSAYTQQLGRGFLQLRQPALRHYLPLILGILGFYYAFSYGLIQPAIAVRFGFLADEQAIIFTLMALVGALATALLPWMRRCLSDFAGLLWVGLGLAGGYVLAALPLGAGGVGVLFLIRASGALSQPWASVVVNREIPSEDRATTLSTVALISKLPYILLSTLAGRSIESGHFPLFLLAMGGGILFLLVLSAVWSWRDGRRPVLPTGKPTP